MISRAAVCRWYGQSKLLTIAKYFQVAKAQLTSVDEKGSSLKGVHPGSIIFDDIQDLYLLQGKCRSLARAINNNRKVFTWVSKQMQSNEDLGRKSMGRSSSNLRSVLIETEMERERVAGIVKRLDDSMTLVSNGDI